MKKDLPYYLKLNYSIRVKENEDGSYFAEVEELPGCITEGDSKTEALTMIEDAKRAWLETALEKKITIPEPTDLEYSGKLNVRLPKSLHRLLAYRAKEEGVSLNSYISHRLSALG